MPDITAQPLLPCSADAQGGAQHDETRTGMTAFAVRPFAYDGRPLTLDAFLAHVASYPFGPIAPSQIILHGTANPAASWAPSPGVPNWDAGESGLSLAQIQAKRAQQLRAIKTYYVGLGWDAGPHLFIDDRWVWLFTPLDTIGIHANSGNSYRIGGALRYSIGIEIVGRYATTRWPPVIIQQLRGVVGALGRRLDIQIAYTAAPVGQPARHDRQLALHRDYTTAKDCPGKAIEPAWAVSALSAGAATPPAPTITADAAILAPARCTAAQAAAAILAHPHGAYTDLDVGAILAAYWRICGPVGVDPCLCVAQLIHETSNLMSFWSSRPQRNPAGLGVTGQWSTSKPPKGVAGWAWNDDRDMQRWEYGLSFACWDPDAVVAHVGRLLAYATRAAARTSAQQTLAAQALSVRSLHAAYQGMAPTLRGLGGRWAVPGADYPTRIAVIAERLRTTEVR